MTKLVGILLIGGATVGVMILADLYYRLLTRWCPPDERGPEGVWPDIEPFRYARVRRAALDRVWTRRPYDRAVDEDLA